MPQQKFKPIKKCYLFNKPDRDHDRVKSIIHKDWIFYYLECLHIISKQTNYSYGGTKKSKLKKNLAKPIYKE